MGTSVASNAPAGAARWAALVILALVSLAAANAFVQDDAFISFRYAEHLANGQGLTWNPGESPPIEGYTNFLWTLLMAAAIALGLDPVPVSLVVGLLAVLATLVLTHRLGLWVLGSSNGALLAIVLLGTNFTFSSYATGGLETQLQTLLVVAAALIAVRILRSPQPYDLPSLVALSALGGLAALTRLDTVLLIGVSAAAVAIRLWQVRDGAGRRRVAALLALVVPAAALVVPWMVWKLGYYGTLLPNTFHLKASYLSFKVLKYGVFYVGLFVVSYFALAAVYLLLAHRRAAARALASLMSLRSPALLLATSLALWLFYVVRVGGDFMEFRFLVPVLPFLFVLLSGWIVELEDHRARSIVVFLLLLSSLAHALLFPGARGIDSIPTLRAHLSAPDRNWIGVGRLLHDLFGAVDPPVTIAVTAAGAVPFYSQLPTVDMLGINDRWVATQGPILSARPGHRRRATLEYLVRRDVNVVVGHPLVEPLAQGPDSAGQYEGPLEVTELDRFSIVDLDPAWLPPSSRVVELLLDSEHRLLVLELCPHPAAGQLLANAARQVLAISGSPAEKGTAIPPGVCSATTAAGRWADERANALGPSTARDSPVLRAADRRPRVGT